MTKQNNWRPGLKLRRRRGVYQALAGSSLLLFFSLITAVSSRLAFGYDLFRQSPQQSRDSTESERVLQEARKLLDEASKLNEAGKFDEALPLAVRSLEISEKYLGAEHRDVVDAIDLLASIYVGKGEYDKAEPLYLRSLAVREKKFGKNHLETAISLNSLAGLYQYQGRYVEAEPLYKRALEIREKELGEDNPDTAESYHNLASLYRLQGRYNEAEPLFKRSLAICEKAIGKDHPIAAIILDNLATLYQKMGKYEEAEPLFKRSLEIREKKLGKDHPETAESLNNMAYLYEDMGKYAEAELLLKRALDFWEKSLGKDHPKTGASINNLARLYYYQGKYEEAEPLYKRALGICVKKLGKDHPETGFILDYIAALYAAKGDFVQAVKFQALADTTVERNIAHNLVIGSERQKLAYLDIVSGQIDRTISLHLRYAPDDPAARDMAATMILQRKGRALDATSQNLNALRNRFSAEDQALLDRLTETRSQIARLVLGGPQKMIAEQYQTRIKELEEQADKDEADIGSRNSEFRAQSLPVTLEAVLAAIPADSALIEFTAYRPFNAKPTKNGEAYGQPRYVAYILRREREIEWKDLGDAKTIDMAIASLRQALRDPKRADVKRLARVVDAKVFQPLRPLLGGKSRLLISPDGSLNLIPFPALVDESGHYAVERYPISYLTSGRDLLRLQVERESKGAPLVVAAPDFGRRSQIEVAHSEKPKKGPSTVAVNVESGRSNVNGFYFPPLLYAAEEGEALRALLPGATLLTKGQATKAALSQARSPELLHIATHGFFLEDQPLPMAGERGAHSPSDDPERALRQLEGSNVRIESPLLRSGLALAGANEHREDDNGILTALEVTGLNLWGTKLVVLSACDTGVGEVKNGEGVYGLRRALTLAGAETQVMSLWAVSDKATQELMVSYYRRLQQGQGRGDAMRQAQLEMLKKPNRRHPYYWANFIQSGKWGSIDGRR
ncbi:MAG: CHAT domain-containing protein [Chloracidobacterium sp.]|nr:CHAT domain-containing protein [Chloracidobacterium sp.]